MTIEDGEEVFGKRWNEWTSEEIRQFVQVLEVSNLRLALNLRWAMAYFELLTTECQMFLREHGYKE